MALNTNSYVFITPLTLSPTVTSNRPCDCPFCVSHYSLPANHSALSEPISPVPSAKYFGSYLTPIVSSIPDVLFRCSQAPTVFEQFEPFFRNVFVSNCFSKKKLQYIFNSLSNSSSWFRIPSFLTGANH